MKNFVIRCERCGCSVHVGDIKKMERFKELHISGECFPRKFGRIYLCHFGKEKRDHEKSL